LSAWWFAVLRVPAGFEKGFWQGLSTFSATSKPFNLPQGHAR